MSERHQGNVVEMTREQLRSRLGTRSEAERRTDNRVSARLEVDIPVPSWEQLQRVYTTNISDGGLMFVVEAPVTLPGIAEITLTLPDAQTITLQSEIRHAAPGPHSGQVEVGVQFKALDPAVRERLEQAIELLRTGNNG
jgi:c-di-GMP-binding flagellar brake protein YcgR